jgi:hypothetical protein
VEVMAIQESKLGAVDKTLCAQLWDGDGWCWLEKFNGNGEK